MKTETIEIQKEMFAEGTSSAAKYGHLVVGRPGWWALLKYEFVISFMTVPGALGLYLRSKLYPLLLKKCGRNVTFGYNVTMRHPHKIEIGDNVVIDDNCLLDAKGQDNTGIRIGSGVFVGRNSILSCKNGDIVIGDHANIGFNCEIFSASNVTVGPHSLVAAMCYLIGGGHDYDQVEVPILQQGRCSKGIALAENVWLGAGVKVLDGVSIGAHSIVGAGGVVTRDVPERTVSAGVPAKPVRTRT
jgi:acetyltransferase-like isoleucine patch superfamily enzyme